MCTTTVAAVVVVMLTLVRLENVEARQVKNKQVTYFVTEELRPETIGWDLFTDLELSEISALATLRWNTTLQLGVLAGPYR